MKVLKAKFGKIPTNADCLIYNLFQTGTGTSRVDRFIRYDLKDVFWDETKEANAIRMGTSNASSVNMFVDNLKDYVSSSEWKLLTIEEMQKKFTFQKTDYIIQSTSFTIDAPKEFNSESALTTYFGLDYAHKIMSFDEKILPNRSTSHYEIAGQ